MEGYQIIELDAVDKLIRVNSSLEIQIVLILWLIEYVKAVIPNESVEIDLIKVEYMGAYPAIGVKYPSQDSPDLEAFVINKCEQVLSSTTVDDLLLFLNKNINSVKTELAKF